MCGRYVSPGGAAIEREFNLIRSASNQDYAPDQKQCAEQACLNPEYDGIGVPAGVEAPVLLHKLLTIQYLGRQPLHLRLT